MPKDKMSRLLKMNHPNVVTIQNDEKLAFVAFATAMVILGIEHWNDIYSFILNQVLQR